MWTQLAFILISTLISAQDDLKRNTELGSIRVDSKLSYKNETFYGENIYGEEVYDFSMDHTYKTDLFRPSETVHEEELVGESSEPVPANGGSKNYSFQLQCTKDADCKEGRRNIEEQSVTDGFHLLKVKYPNFLNQNWSRERVNGSLSKQNERVLLEIRSPLKESQAPTKNHTVDTFPPDLNSESMYSTRIHHQVNEFGFELGFQKNRSLISSHKEIKSDSALETGFMNQKHRFGYCRTERHERTPFSASANSDPDPAEIDSEDLLSKVNEFRDVGYSRTERHVSTFLHDGAVFDSDPAQIDSEDPDPDELGDEEPVGRKHTMPTHESVVGGKTIPITELPFLAILKVFKNTGPVYCTSSILSENWVLTAAHCIGRVTDPKRVEVIAGQTNIRDQGWTRTTQQRKAVHLVQHPNYTHTNSPGNGDLALIKVAPPFILDNIQVSSIKLRGEPWFTPSRKTNCTSAGWGRQRFRARNMGPLQSFQSVATHGSDSCPCISARRKPRVICLEKTSGQGICKGDSGGPLICNNELVGVAHVLYPTPLFCIAALSGQPECGVRGWVDVYMYTCPYLDWIRSYVGQSVPPQPRTCSSAEPIPPTTFIRVAAAVLTIFRFLVPNL